MSAFHCKTCEDAGFWHGTCTYCDEPLDGRHEHDHAPVPRRHNGEQIMPCCVRCHNLKDRAQKVFWDQDTLRGAIEGLDPLSRIIVAMACSMWHDSHGVGVG